MSLEVSKDQGNEDDKDKDDNEQAVLVETEESTKDHQEEEDVIDPEQQKTHLLTMPAMLTDTMTSDIGDDEMVLNNTLDNCQVDVLVKNNRAMTPTPKESSLSGESPTGEDLEVSTTRDLPVSEDSPLRDSTISREAPARESTIVVKAKRDLKDLEQQLVEKEKERVTTFMLEETRIRKEREKLILQQEELKNERLKLELEGERARLARLQEKQKEEEKRHKQDLEDSRLIREKDVPQQQETLESQIRNTTDNQVSKTSAVLSDEALKEAEHEEINTLTVENGEMVTSTPADKQPKKVGKEVLF